MKKPTTRARASKATPTKPAKDHLSDADASSLIAWCISISAAVAHDLEEAGECETGLYASLKWMQLKFDRQTRALLKAGQTAKLGQLLPPVPSPSELAAEYPAIPR